MMLFSWACLFLAINHVFAEAENDDDLMSFVTLPKIRALKFDILYHDRESVAPGYWFVAPYGIIEPETPTNQWKPCQVGPYIYDADGTLIWAGSCMFDNRNVFDFKAANNIDDEPHLSFILQHAYHDDGSDKGYGYILDQHYEEQFKVPVVNNLGAFNMHEFNVLDGGETALACLYRSENTDLAAFGRPQEHGWITTGGLVELNTTTGEVLFEWSSFGNIDVDESVKVGSDWGPSGKPGWDYVHVNSADKNSAGDYLLSARFTGTLYYISGQDRRIVWRLGGKYSDFNLDFTFSKQHHARFLESNGTHHLISFLNNASDEAENEENVSSALYVQIDTTTIPFNATVVKRIERPDGGLTRLRGSVQTLPSGNVFVGWSERGYHSEHSPDGRVLMEAKFASTRFSSYRSYKFPFTGRPKTPPDVVASVYGTDETDLTTIFHVSWNGATDIATWKFYARSEQDESPVLVGNTTKVGFETMYIADGYMDWVSVEAVDKDGNVLGKSDVHRTDTPTNWRLAGFLGDEEPQPVNPSIFLSLEEDEGDVEDMDAMDDAEDMEGMESMEHLDEMEDADDLYPDPEEAAEAILKAYDVVRGVGGFLIFILIASSVGGLMAGAYFHIRKRRTRYHEIPSDEQQPMSVPGS